MADSAHDKTLPATPRKISKAREQGQVPRSRDLGHFAAFFVAALGFVLAAPHIGEDLRKLLATGLRFDAAVVANPQAMAGRMATFVWEALWVIVPLGLVMAVVGLVSSVASGGWNFSWKAMEPKWERFNPISGVGRMFSLDQVGPLLKTCGLAVVLGVVAALYMRSHVGDFAHSLAIPLPAAIAHVGDTLMAGLLLLILALGAFALVDVPLQRFLWAKRLRMSHTEVKQENKDVEGNAEVKSKIKVRMREMANRRMLAAVPGADVVVMNPTHFAVALKYEEGGMAAPRVIAKGADLMAFRIRDAAHAAGVPVLQSPPLARALYAHVEVDREIPAALFAAVAQVLAWVYQLRAALSGQGPAPSTLPDLPVPPDMDPRNRRTAAEVEPA